MLLSKRSRKIPFPKGDIVLILKHRYFMKEKCPEVTDEDSMKSLAAIEEDMSQRVILQADGCQVTVRARKESQIAGAGKAISRERRKYSPVELLMSLHFSLAIELPKVMFDYLAFHKSCWEVLECAYDVYGSVLEHDMGPVVGKMLDDLQQYRLPYSVDLILAMGIPYSMAKKMIRKITMPSLPAVTQEYQQVIDQGAIFKAVGKAVENEIASGRLKKQSNIRARALIETRPEMVCFEVQTVDDGGGRITFKNHKMWQHKDSACTKNTCVCGVKATFMLKPGWRQVVSDYAEKVLDSVKWSMVG